VNFLHCCPKKHWIKTNQNLMYFNRCNGVGTVVSLPLQI
jgi:hypothetical protein